MHLGVPVGDVPLNAMAILLPVEVDPCGVARRPIREGEVREEIYLRRQIQKSKEFP